MRKTRQVIMYYSAGIESEMVKFYNSLSEKDKRRYAAIEAKKLGHGGIKYISELFGCHRNTITEGKSELENREVKKFNEKAIREKGGGRKSCFDQIPELDEAFLSVVKEHTAGDPMEEETKWTYLNQSQIVEAHIPQVLLVVLQIICTLHKWCSSLIRITSNGVVQMYYSICRVNLRNVG